ncbi:MAG: hypothetical protein ACK4VI_01320 [Alphaproteobacteria bacterium]
MTFLSHKTLLFVLPLLVLLAFLSEMRSAQAQGWTQYRDEDGIFQVLIPENYRISKRMLRHNESEMLISTELSAVVDQRPYKDVTMQFIIKYDQTFTTGIPRQDVPSLLENELEKYIAFYSEFGGILRNREIGSFGGGYSGGELFITYMDKEHGLQSIRVRIMYTDSTKVEQIVIGPEDTMNSQRVREYFNSLSIRSGRTSFPGDFEEEWSTFTSPFDLFAQRFPRSTIPYMPAEPKVAFNERTERVATQFVDPVYGYTLFYNTYGYRFNTLMTKENVQQILLDRHLRRFRVDIGRIQFAHGSQGQYPVMTVVINVAAPSRYPYMNAVKLLAHYYGNFVAVQEFAGNSIHIDTLLAQNLQTFFKFDPVRGHQKLLRERAGEPVGGNASRARPLSGEQRQNASEQVSPQGGEDATEDEALEFENMEMELEDSDNNTDESENDDDPLIRMLN